MITDYQSLQNEIIRALKRSDLATDVKTMIQLAEAEINRRLRTQAMEAVATAPLTDNQQYYPMPDDLAELRNLYIDSVPLNKLDYRTPMQLVEEYAYITGGRPIEAYTLVDGGIKLNAPASVPDPATAANLVISYWKKFPALSDTNTTNWLITDAPDLLYFGALVQGERYIGRDKRIAVWKTAYNEVMSEVNRQEDRKRHSGAPLVQRAATRGDYRQAIRR